MKNILLAGLLLAFFFFPLCAAAGDVTIYVVPAVSDNKILPKSSIPSSYISDTISVKASPGEFESVSFVVQANKTINGLTIETTNLIGSEVTIQKKDIDIRTVKCWYQGGYNDFGSLTVSGRFLTPEILLKDDSLIKVTGEDWIKGGTSNSKGTNYLKLTNGSYIDISNISSLYSDSLIIPISSRPVRDATTLQPVILKKGYNKQFWITIKVPNNVKEGNYKGTITLKTKSKIIQQLYLNLEVLPIVLSKPSIEYSIYYRGTITDQGSISSEFKTKSQFSAENMDMLNHGITNPTVYPMSTDDLLKQVLSIRNKVGIDNTNLYYLGLGSDSESKLSYYKNLTAPYGVTDIYVYFPDEQDLNNEESRTKMTAIHNVGGKVMDAQSLSQADSVAEILDLAVVSSNPAAELANKYHNYNHKIYSYGNPQIVPECPRLFRMNYGFMLWQNNYDGAMDYAYQHSFGDIWNDFDSNDYRDHVFAYPTMNGVLDTIQWEGFREGVDDMRYLTTLQNTILLAKRQGVDTSAAENYLSNLKNSDLSSQDLDEIRGQMINYILTLQSQLNVTSPSNDNQTDHYCPVASFTANEAYGKEPLSVVFTDTSTGSPTAWNWNFGDGTANSTVQNPIYTYSTTGNYTVMLTVNNSEGSNTTTKSGYIKVTEAAQKPVVHFWGSRVSGNAPLTIGFTDNSTGSPTEWNWDFGDGTYSKEQKPKHTYSKAGTYSVTLTASNAAGSGTKTRSNYIKLTK